MKSQLEKELEIKRLKLEILERKFKIMKQDIINEALKRKNIILKNKLRNKLKIRFLIKKITRRKNLILFKNKKFNTF